MSLTIAPVGKLRTSASVERRPLTIIAGSTVTWFGDFTHPTTGALMAAAGDVEFRFIAPGGDVETPLPGLVVSTGTYGANHTPAQTGTWVVKLYSSGAWVDEKTFVVAASVATTDPVTPTLVIGPGDDLALVVSSDLVFVAV